MIKAKFFFAFFLAISFFMLLAAPTPGEAALVGTNNNAVLTLSPQVSIYRVGPVFPVDVFINTHGQGVDTVAAYINYNASLFYVDSIDYSGSVFTVQAESSTSSPVGMIKITRGIAAPNTVNVSNGKVATIYFKGLGDAAAAVDNLNFSFAPGDATKSAVFMAGVNILSGVYNAQYSLDGTSPANVSSFSAAVASQQVTLSWSNPLSSDFAGVVILRKVGSFPVSPADGVTVYDGTGTSYVDAGLNNGTTYYYKAFSRDIVLNYSSGVQVSVIPQDSVAPASIGNFSATALTAGSIRLNWTAVGDDGNTGTATSYDIRYSTSAITASNFSLATQASGAPAPKFSGSAEAFTLFGFAGNTTYYFAIKAVDEANNASVISNVPFAKTYRTADLNSDNLVNAQDFSILMSFWGSASRPAADINQDGSVNAQDFSIMMSQWG